MKEQLKDVRIRIDGLSQLVKELNPEMFIIPISLIPKNVDANDILQFAQNSQTLFIEESKESVQKINSTETQKCYESLSLANHWLRELSKELGDTDFDSDKGIGIFPKKESLTEFEGREMPNNSDIDGFPFILKGVPKLVDLTYNEKINWLMVQISEIRILTYRGEEHSTHIAMYTEYAWKCLSEANFWLTLELQRIKENYEKGS